MRNNRVCKADQIRLIMECRKSGLSDYQWCEQNGIYAGTFYNWVSKLRKSGYTFPDAKGKASAKPNIQEAVKVDIVEEASVVEQNVSFPEKSGNPVLAAELQIGNVTLRLFNGADQHVIQNALKYLGGGNRAW